MFMARSSAKMDQAPAGLVNENQALETVVTARRANAQEEDVSRTEFLSYFFPN
jgi:hypothetical protein